jgi:hypothetical protein
VGETFGFERYTKQKGRAEVSRGTAIQFYAIFEVVMGLTGNTS